MSTLEPFDIFFIHPKNLFNTHDRWWWQAIAFQQHFYYDRVMNLWSNLYLFLEIRTQFSSFTWFELKYIKLVHLNMHSTTYLNNRSVWMVWYGMVCLKKTINYQNFLINDTPTYTGPEPRIYKTRRAWVQ